MRPRFSLRTLFAVMTLIAVLFGWRWFNYLRAERLVRYLLANPKSLRYVEEDWKCVTAKAYTGGSWRNWWLPPVVVTLKYNVPVTHEKIAVIEQSPLGF